ncbi:O-antigen polymerase [Syntrophorhabdus aromaticivorans]|uniref:O-antigen polymerase n=1 Tax=Syntrophorhabdus aromaticivorans TaxID=328301 RepID=UPI0012EB583F|nr:O-antigen polymerase [Syntrophorhabdus aromaticivorans]
MLPFVALTGIYIFNILGSWSVINDEYLYTDFYYYSLLAIIVAFYIFYIVVFSLDRKLYIDWTPLNHTPADRQIIVPFLVLLWGFSFFMFFLYYSRHGLPAVFDLNFSEHVKFYDVRAEKSTDLPEGMHWYSLGFNTIPAFIFCFTYTLKRTVSSPRVKTIFYLNLPLVLFFSALTMHKTPFAYLVLYALLINMFLSPKSFNVKKLLGYTAVMIGSIIVFVRIYLLDRGLNDVFLYLPEYFFNRVFACYTRAHAYMIIIFPNQHDFFNGITFNNPGGIFPFEPVNLSQFLGYWVEGRLSNYPPPSFSQAYANFGTTGFALSLLIMFVQITIGQIIFKKCPKNPLFLALYSLVIPMMLGYSMQSIDTVIGIIFVIVMMIILSIYYVFRDMFSTIFIVKRST